MQDVVQPSALVQELRTRSLLSPWCATAGYALRLLRPDIRHVIPAPSVARTAAAT